MGLLQWDWWVLNGRHRVIGSRLYEISWDGAGIFSNKRRVKGTTCLGGCSGPEALLYKVVCFWSKCGRRAGDMQMSRVPVNTIV